jgi:hypothetical protein
MVDINTVMRTMGRNDHNFPEDRIFVSCCSVSRKRSMLYAKYYYYYYYYYYY